MWTYFLKLRNSLTHKSRDEKFKNSWLVQECYQVHSISLLCPSQNFDSDSLCGHNMTALKPSIVSFLCNIQVRNEQLHILHLETEVAFLFEVVFLNHMTLI